MFKKICKIITKAVVSKRISALVKTSLANLIGSVIPEDGGCIVIDEELMMIKRNIN